MATHSSVLAWRVPETGEPGELPSMGRTESDTTEATQQQQQQEQALKKIFCGDIDYNVNTQQCIKYTNIYQNYFLHTVSIYI